MRRKLAAICVQIFPSLSSPPRVTIVSKGDGRKYRSSPVEAICHKSKRAAMLRKVPAIVLFVIIILHYQLSGTCRSSGRQPSEKFTFQSLSCMGLEIGDFSDTISEGLRLLTAQPLKAGIPGSGGCVHPVQRSRGQFPAGSPPRFSGSFPSPDQKLRHGRPCTVPPRYCG